MHGPPLIPLLAILLTAPTHVGAEERDSSIEVRHDGNAGRMETLIAGQVAFTCRYGDEVDLPYYILFSPSGKQMLVERTDPYPHHRCFWLADTVQLEGKRKVSFYNAWYTRVDKGDPKSPFRDHIRHVGTKAKPAGEDKLQMKQQLVWEMDENVPVLEETRDLTVTALGHGEYFIDLTFTVTAAHGDLAFVSDAVHYAWPYLRMTKEFSVQGGGTITNSEGGVNQKQTNMKPATWVDYSNTIDGTTEGVAVFSHPDNEHPHKWLTRDYGCFGPRRVDEKSGKKFTLARGESMKRRVGIFVHRGNVADAQIAQRYRQYCEGKL